mgnify:CR=1 FL=1
MIQQAIDELNKINCTEYTGTNAAALMAMDMDNLESLLRQALVQEEIQQDKMEAIKDDFLDLAVEFDVLKDSISTLQDAIGNLGRHFK